MKKYCLAPLMFYLISMGLYYGYSFIKVDSDIPVIYIIVAYSLVAIPLFSISYGYIAGRGNKNAVGPTIINSLTAVLFSLAPYMVSRINNNENKMFLLLSLGVMVVVGLITYFPAVQGAKKGVIKAEKYAEKEAKKHKEKKEEERRKIEEELKEKLAREKEEEFRKQTMARSQEEIDQEIKEMEAE
ncbi:MAG: hypothetical protein ACRDA4_01445 [Filifactoraceae bacterium]